MEESTTQYQSFGRDNKTPSVAEFAKKVTHTPPPVGSTPEQVRQHYSNLSTSVNLPERVEQHYSNSPTSVLLPELNPVSTQAPAAQPAPVQNPVRQPTQDIPGTANHAQVNTQPVFNSSSEGVSVNLPSHFVFYPFKELYIHPFRGKHLSKLARAKQEKNPRLLAEVISSVLEVPGNNTPGLAFHLTLPDYYWLLYFQRKSCYTKTSFQHTTRCNNHIHIQEVLEGKKQPESLVINSIIDLTRLEVTEYTPAEVPEILKGLNAHCPTVGSFVLTVEDERFGNEDYEFLARLACMILPELPWQERLDAAGELTAEQILALHEYEKDVTAYGVKEKAMVNCKECGASLETTLSIDASSFLPSS